MPWNNNNNNNGGGGWKSGGGGGGGGGGPWGQGGGGNQPPDLEDFLKRGQDKLKQVMPGSGIPGPLIMLLGLAAAAAGCFFAFAFIVQPDQQGVVLRFGQYVRTMEPGLHLRWPYPVEEVRLPRVTQQNIIEVGMRTSGRSGVGGGIRDVPEESLMLTGDENIVDVDFTVYWRIRPERDAKSGKFGVEQFLFNIQNPEVTVKEVAESAMREIVGQSNIQPILTEARQKTEQAVQKLIQEILDSYGAGIRIDQVQLQKVDPPNEVLDAFRDVQAARADKERLQNEANTYANQKLPEARGAAERILQEAEGFRQQTIAEASGQSARFLKVYEEYKKAPEVTRRRIFLETMERVMGGADKIIIDNKGGQGVVPFLPLDQMQKK